MIHSSSKKTVSKEVMSEPREPRLPGNAVLVDKRNYAKTGLWAALRSCGPIWQTFGLSLLIICLLELWRPYYFLTDDNLTYWLPLVASMGRNTAHGASPFVNAYLFGGNFNLLQDPSSLSFWNPVVQGLALLANTRFLFLIVDLVAGVYFLLGSTLFALMLYRLREWRALKLSDRRIVFLSLSYTFSAYALLVGSAWVMFLANQAMLPLLVLGLLHPQRAKGIGLVTLSLLMALLMGHISPLIFTVLFVSFFVVVQSWADKSIEPMVRWGAGGLLCLCLASPILWASVSSFTGSSRSSPLSLQDASVRSIPLLAFISSFFGGWTTGLILYGLGLQTVNEGQTFVSFAGAFLIFNGRCRMLGAKLSTLKSTLQSQNARLQIVVVLSALLVMLFVVRPEWLGSIMSKAPLYRSLRWPFRETFAFLFFIHLWFALRPPRLDRPARYATVLVGFACFLLSLICFNPWSFNLMERDRALVISGEADRYWAGIKSRLKSNDQIIVIIPPPIMKRDFFKIPYSLLGAYNYPALFQVPSITGYTAVGLARENSDEAMPYHWSGAFSPEVGNRLLQQNPRLKALRLVSMHPLRIDFCTRQGQTPLQLPPMATQMK
jgi:hypothetical protein